MVRVQHCVIVILATAIPCAYAAPQFADEPSTTDTAAPPNAGAGSAPSPALWPYPVEALDSELPSWLQLSGQYRARAERPVGIKYTTTRDAYVLSQLRLDLEIHPTDWLILFTEGQDSRVAFNHHIANAMPYQDTWDIRQAYVQIGADKEGWADLMAGRQVFNFGDGRVVGPSDWINEGRTFDAVRLDLHHDRYKLSLLASSVVVGRDGVIDHHIEGNDLYGAYGAVQNLIPGGTIEPYVFWRLAPATLSMAETAHRGHLSEATPGVHLAGTLPGRFDYDIEMDAQRGTLGVDTIRSWAGYWNLGRSFAHVPSAPRLFAEGNYATGNNNPTGTTWSTFDQIYPTSHNKLDFADQVGRKNVEQIRAGGRESVFRKLKLNETWEDIWLATTHDALYASSGAVSVAADPAAPSRHVGQELDFWAEAELDRGLSGGAGYCRLFAGPFLKAATSGKDYNYPFIFLTYRFRP